MTVYADLGDESEDTRIAAIGTAASRGALVGFIVEDDKKADRYIKKLEKRFPLVSVVDRGQGPIEHSVLVRVRGRAN